MREAAKRKGQEPSCPTTALPEAELQQAREAALIAYLESDQTDADALARLEALPGGKEQLARALAIKAALAPLAARMPSVDQYLARKRDGIEAEQARDERRYAQHP
jgi:hypothetical protein